MIEETTTEASTSEEDTYVHLTPSDFGLGLFDDDSPEMERSLSIMRAKARKRSKVLKSRQDVNEFAEYAFKDAETGADLQQADIHREMQEALSGEEKTRVLIEFPRNHGKTTQLIIREIFKLGNNPNRRSKIICESDSLARKRLLSIRQHIEDNPRVHDVFPNLKPGKTWDKTQIQIERTLISNDASIEACGVLTAGTGGRADELVFDDPVGFRNAIAIPALRDTVRKAIFEDWMNLLEPSGRISVAATGWTTDDAVHDMKSKPNYFPLRRPISDDYVSPWPEKWPKEKLLEKLEDIGTRAFQRGWLLIPFDGEIAVVQKEWIDYWDLSPDLDKMAIFLAYDIIAGDNLRKNKGKSDYFAVAVVGVDLEIGKIFVLGSAHGKFSLLAQAERVIGDTIAWDPNLIGIEAS